ncbi:Lysine decarboxylase [Nostocoides japonicum T1-X7]|uniref:Lysine decarboxylase n=2 Tax=Nostocoides japonicum TaxID=99481 RepID=A0A077LYA4_9MICO|nr:Lysine decarboxylase [Tetrasphaera japonica T1-X7]
MSEFSAQAYNAWWQARLDAWSQVEEEADRRVRSVDPERAEAMTAAIEKDLELLSHIERYWAYPGKDGFLRIQELFRTGGPVEFARAVAQVKRGVSADYSYGATETRSSSDLASDGVESLEPNGTGRQRYFEVLVVERMTVEQERALREDLRRWRRPDDEFIYDIVVVGSGEEAFVAMWLNPTIQACVIRKRFGHASSHDLSLLSQFLDPGVRDRLDRHTPRERIDILADELSEIRPEVDLYLMTEVAVEEVAGSLSPHFRRVFHAREGLLELHLSILDGVAHRYRTPFFDALRSYAHRPTGSFHALPIGQGKSVVTSHWINDMVDFYGLNIFLAETSATGGGLDSLLEPTGPLRDAQQLASEAFGSTRSYFVTNGTSTANKIVGQANVGPNDIVLVDRNCHQSHHYGLMLAGARVSYLDAYPLNEYAMYGAVPLTEIKGKLLDLKRAGKLDRVKMVMLTNCTFDGILYDVQRVMEECLAIKPDLVFLWDEAWFAFGRFHPVYRTRTAMYSAERLVHRLRSPELRERFEEQAAALGDDPDDETLLTTRLVPDPDRARVRVYATQSTHKTLTSLRQGSMIHVFDQDFSGKVAEAFHEAYMAHTSTSPNYQILASLDIGRRQAALEGYELVQKQLEFAMRLRDAIDNHPLLRKYMRCLSTADLIPEAYRPSGISQPLRSGLRNMINAWDHDEFVLDPSRITLSIAATGIDGATFKSEQLMDRFGIQINKTSRNTVLFMTNIGTSRSSVAYLIEALVSIARDLERKFDEMSPWEFDAHRRAVARLTAASAPLPNFGGFHEAFREPSDPPTPEGDMRKAFFGTYADGACEYVLQANVEERVRAGEKLVSATFVTPYPPGFPVLVPGQVITEDVLEFMARLDTPEVHGYQAEVGYRIYRGSALPAPKVPSSPNGTSTSASVSVDGLPMDGAGDGSSPEPAAVASAASSRRRSSRSRAGAVAGAKSAPDGA